MSAKGENNSGISDLRSNLSLSDTEYKQHISAAAEIARQFAINLSSEMDGPDGYESWRLSYVDQVERQFPMNRIEHYYFFYGRKLSEIAGGITLGSTLLRNRESLAPAVDVGYQFGKYIKDCEYTLFRLTASAALLSSEPRHGYFGIAFRTLNERFEPFRSLDITGMANEEINSLRVKLDEYHALVQELYDKCSQLLADLGV